LKNLSDVFLLLKIVQFSLQNLDFLSREILVVLVNGSCLNFDIRGDFLFGLTEIIFLHFLKAHLNGLIEIREEKNFLHVPDYVFGKKLNFLLDSLKTSQSRVL
jgi:hypothetical protein